ncbi:hypothetical protein [Helicobacter pametensis]|uniref:hypothetical protein n=1 Tax=Helicobacter pametensis TaxID=95149 RepID=UPI00047FB522|nr:hypothetical protein [Helicobacter pametensis]
MDKILILTASDPSSNPRPRRMIENLRECFELYAIGIGSGVCEGVKMFSFSSYQKRNFWQEMKLYMDVLCSKWEKLIWTKNRLEIVPLLQSQSFDAIICFDLPLLPIALKYKKNAKVIFDAQEYFPEWITSDFRWNLLFKRFYTDLCREYLPQADCVLSVSPSFVKRYAQEFGISPVYYPSWPYFYDLPPSEVKSSIRILYHGALSSNRSIEDVVCLSDGLEECFELHLVLVGGESHYRAKIEQMIKTRWDRGQKIFLHQPVKFEEIIPFGNQFDIGLYYMPPKTYNLLGTIPNKVFEYIGSSLMLVSTPNPDVKDLIADYDLGRVSRDFSLEAMIECINALSEEDVKEYKLRSFGASKLLNNAQNQGKILGLLRDLLGSNSHFIPR